MKALILAACVGSTVAVVAPQFPPPAVSFAAAGNGMDVRPFSIYGESASSAQDPNRPNFMVSGVQMGTIPAEFVVTDVLTAFEDTPIYSLVLKVNGSPIAARGNVQGNTVDATFHLQHGIPLSAGSLLEVETRTVSVGASPGKPVRITVAGYLR